MTALLTAALRFRVLVLGLAAVLVAAGVVALPKMHNDALPELSPGPVLEVQTEAPGLSSQEVEQYVTVPLENNLLDGIMGVWDVRSNSIGGLSKVDLYFQPATTELHARQLVEERLTNAFSLPNVAKPPQLIQPLSTTSRALLIGLRSNTISQLELSYLARWIVKPRLSGVSGVANVVIFGQKDRQIQVQVDSRRLAQHHVTLQQVIDTTGNSQLVSPLSYLEGSSPGTGGFLDGHNQRLDIRPVLPLGTPRKLGNLPVADAGGKVSLGQVANIVEGHQSLIGSAVLPGSYGLVLEIQKLPSASLVGVTNGVERALSDLRPALRGVTVDSSFFKPARYVSSGLHNLALGLAAAAALAILALGALLLDARATCVAALSIALSLTAALLVLQWLGQTVNALVVLGLLLASVALIDDAVGGGYALRRAGPYTRAAAAHTNGNGNGRAPQPTLIQSFARMRGTLGYATLIILLLVAPVFFSQGLTARYLHPMMLSLGVAVLCSALIGVTVTPALCAVLLELRPPRRRIALAASKVADGYERLVHSALAIPRTALLVAGLAGMAAGVSFPFLHQPAPPRLKDRDLIVHWSGPAGAGLGEMNRITGRTVDELRALPAVADAAAVLGRAVGGERIVDPSSGEIFVSLRSGAEYDRAVDQVRRVALGTPGVDASVSTYEADQQAGVLAPTSDSVTVRFYGENYARLRGLATQVQKRIATVAGIGRPQLRLPADAPNIEIAVNDARAHNAGVLPGDARRQASTLVSGLTVGNFFQDEAVFDVVVIGAPAERRTLADIGNLPIDTGGGGQVKLSDIAHVAVRPDPVDISHQALSRYVDVVAPVRPDAAGSVRAGIARALAHTRFPLGYRAEVLGGTPEDPTSHGLFLAFVLAAAIGVLLLLQAAFSNWRLAAMFVLTLPLSLAGGLLVAVVTGRAASLGADAGLLAILAFAARQGIAQVSAMRRLQADEGPVMHPRLVARAAGERLAPSLTAVAVSAGALIPFVVLGDVAGNEITYVAAAVILGGLVTAMLWSALLLPALSFALAPGPPELDLEPLDIDPVGVIAPEPVLVHTNGHGNGNGDGHGNGNGSHISKGQV
jgi:multidrug efflux pump subunit AcrB